MRIIYWSCLSRPPSLRSTRCTLALAPIVFLVLLLVSSIIFSIDPPSATAQLDMCLNSTQQATCCSKRLSWHRRERTQRGSMRIQTHSRRTSPTGNLQGKEEYPLQPAQQTHVQTHIQTHQTHVQTHIPTHSTRTDAKRRYRRTDAHIDAQRRYRRATDAQRSPVPLLRRCCT